MLSARVSCAIKQYLKMNGASGIVNSFLGQCDSKFYDVHSLRLATTRSSYSSTPEKYAYLPHFSVLYLVLVLVCMREMEVYLSYKN